MTERVTLQVLLGNAGFCEYIYLNQTVFDLLLFQSQPSDPHIHTPCGSVQFHHFGCRHTIAPVAHEGSKTIGYVNGPWDPQFSALPFLIGILQHC
jgi:hypothetical protein